MAYIIAETKVSVKGGGEILQKLQSLTNAVHGTKVAISSLTEQTTTATKNLAALANLTWQVLENKLKIIIIVNLSVCQELKKRPI